MTEQSMIRLAMVLQNQVASTLDKYICKLAEAVLFEHTEGMAVLPLGLSINDQFNLSFSSSEIQTAIARKAKNSIEFRDGLYYLRDDVRVKMGSGMSLVTELNSYAFTYISENDLNVSIDEVSSLLQRYIYYCFNSNVNNLLSLFGNRTIDKEVSPFDATDEERILINGFITWENPAKDQLLYKLVATCYEYCMLTVKKDRILAKELFKGKRFYLDANIIFRMIGVNNEERKIVTQDFVRHCKAVGIEMLITSNTLDEIYAVITSQVNFIKNISNASQPISYDVLSTINPGLQVSDFYRLYYDWCQISTNKYGDYLAFHQYLLDLVQETLTQCNIRQSTAFKASRQASLYEDRVANLHEYKLKKRPFTSRHAAETDVSNIMDVIQWRNNKGNGSDTSIWQTNDFLVSADQLLISWAANIFPGIPIVVLPSVWLSIILRFTGRTDDDYRSFCLFLTQRQHPGDTSVQYIDTIRLLTSINAKTIDARIKEKIILEIERNKLSYSFESDEDYDSNVELVFDKVLADVAAEKESEISEIKKEMEVALQKHSQSMEERFAEQSRISENAAREKALTVLSRNQSKNSVKIYRAVSSKGWILYLAGGIIMTACLLVWLFEFNPLYTWMISFLPVKIAQDSNLFLIAWTILTSTIGLLVTALKRILISLGSEERENRLYKKYYEKNKVMIEENPDSDV